MENLTELKYKLIKEWEIYSGMMVEGRDNFKSIYEGFKQYLGKTSIDDFEWFLDGFDDFINYRIGQGCFSNYITAICLEIEKVEQ